MAQSVKVDKEAIARIIDPQAWDLSDHWNGIAKYRDTWETAQGDKDAADFRRDAIERTKSSLERTEAILVLMKR